MQKISVTSFQVKSRAKKHFTCQRVGGLSKISPPLSPPSPYFSPLEVKTQTSNDENNEQEDFQDYLQQQPAPIIAQIETPLFGTISVTENPFAENHCIFCGKALPARLPGTKGRPQIFHTECGQLSRSLDHIANCIEQLNFTPAALRRLRSRLFSISNVKPAPRDPQGRFTRQEVAQ